jgi:hypothetical protein
MKFAQVISPYKYYTYKNNIFKLGCGSLAVYTDTILLFYFVVFVGKDVIEITHFPVF